MLSSYFYTYEKELSSLLFRLGDVIQKLSGG